MQGRFQLPGPPAMLFFDRAGTELRGFRVGRLQARGRIRRPPAEGRTMNTGKVVLVTILAGALSIGAALFGQKWLGDGAMPRLSLGRGSGGSRRQPAGLPPAGPTGREIASSSFGGKVVIINYWASWCPPCVREMPMLIRTQEAFDPGQLQVVGIAIDRQADVETVHRRSSGQLPDPDRRP